MATAGIGRKIRIYSLAWLLRGGRDPEDANSERDEGARLHNIKLRKQQLECGLLHSSDASASAVICTPARLSSIQWHYQRRGVIVSGDYDGVVTEWDVERGAAVVERHEHGGRHVWSVHNSSSEDLCISASDDCSAAVWSGDAERPITKLQTAASVCCAQFSPANAHQVALASANGSVYLYDLRQHSRGPLHVLSGHKRAVSYVRFLSEELLVSASVDSSIRVWRTGCTGDASDIVETFSKHRNVRNFVGLAVRELGNEAGSVVACGSETNHAFVYRMGRQEPVVKHDMASSGHSQAMTSAVCWGCSGSSIVLAAANSDGLVHLLSPT